MSPVLLNPTGRSAAIEVPLAPRKVRDLNGKTVGLLHSTKYNSGRILDAVAELLEERWAVKTVVRQLKPSFARTVPIDMAKGLADRSDVVITGVGD
jgi:hypothetical protein